MFDDLVFELQLWIQEVKCRCGLHKWGHLIWNPNQRCCQYCGACEWVLWL